MTVFEPILFMMLAPLAGGVFLWRFGREWSPERIAGIGLGIAGLVLLTGASLSVGALRDGAAFLTGSSVPWITTLNVRFGVTVDGLSLVMIWLTVLLIPAALLTASETGDRTHRFVALILFLEAGLIGVFVSPNFFQWFLFWELCLIPAYFLVRFSGSASANRAARQFLLYTLAGSVGLLLSFMALFAAVGTFDFIELAQTEDLMSRVAEGLGWETVSTGTLGLILFALAFLGVAVKVPLYPFHTWLPDTYAEAPASVSMLLTGLMSKMGFYALLRIVLPIFTDQIVQLAVWLLGLAVVSVVASALAALAQTDLRRVFAYSSINHLGYCFLGVFAVMTAGKAGLTASVNEAVTAFDGIGLQMFNHGVIAGLLFFLTGRLENRTGGERDLRSFGGLRCFVPRFATTMTIALFASLGLPGLSAFMGEFLIFKGSFFFVGWAPALAVLGLLLTAIIALEIVRRVFAGPPNQRWQDLPDLSRKEYCVVVPALLLLFLGGIWPQWLLEFINGASLDLISLLSVAP